MVSVHEPLLAKGPSGDETHVGQQQEEQGDEVRCVTLTQWMLVQWGWSYVAMHDKASGAQSVCFCTSYLCRTIWGVPIMGGQR
jgi:hypothetical protein